MTNDYLINFKVSLVGIFFFLALNPFISFYPIFTDIQPLVFIPALLIVLKYIVKYQIKLSKLDVSFILFAITVLFVVDVYSDFAFRSRIIFLLVFLVYYVSKKNIHKFNPSILQISILINFIFVLMNEYAFQVYEPIVENLVREVKINFNTYNGPRGMSGLTPEPSYLSGISSAYYMLLFYFRDKGLITHKVFYFFAFMCLYMLLSTKSGTGGILVVILLLYTFFSIDSFKFKIISLLVVTGIVLTYSGLDDSRVVKLVQKSMNSDSEISTLLNDTSVARRAAPYYVAAYSLINYPFGVGGGGYSNVAKEAIMNTDILSVFKTIDSIFVYKVPAAMPIFIVEYGLFYIILFFAILFKGFKVSAYHIFARLVLVFYMIGSFSIVFPLIWVLLSTVNSDINYKKSIKINKNQ